MALKSLTNKNWLVRSRTSFHRTKGGCWEPVCHVLGVMAASEGSL